MHGSPPPRRSRRPPNDGGPSFPLVPLLIGVVVLGFVIGAGLSLVGRHGSPDASVAVAPTTAATIPPVLATPSPLETPSPLATGTETPSPIPSHAAKPSPTPRPVPSPIPSPSPAPTVRPAPTPSAEATREVKPTATPAETESAPAEAAAPTPEPTETPSPAVQGASTPFAQLAGSVVRVFLTSLERGDRDTAVAEMASPPRGPLPEEAVVDENTQIRSLEVHGTGDLVTVDVDLKGPSGAYGAHYTVQKSSTGAAQIVEHSLVKL